jgi:hypothetical protein
MGQVISALPAINTPDARKVRLLTLGCLDGRTNAAKAARALIADLESDLGGADRLSAAERALVVRAAVAGAMVEHMEATWLSGGDYDVLTYTTLAKLQLRLLTALGLRPRYEEDSVDEVVSITRTIVYPEARLSEPDAPPVQLASSTG